MNRDNYPVLRARPELVYLDASNGFPLHEAIIKRVTTLANQYVGMPSKGAYSDSIAVSGIVEETRARVARLIGAEPADCLFVSSATEAARLVAEKWCLDDPAAIVAYSPEDHTATVRALERMSSERIRLLHYTETGGLDGGADDASVFFLNHLHHVYGSDIVPAAFKEGHPDAKLVIDASQSISRLNVDVKRLRADALYFSGHKLGAVPGAGILYIAPEHRSQFQPVDNAGASLPWLVIASIGTAVDILLEKPMNERNLYLAELSNYCIQRLEEIPDMTFSKGVAHALDVCTGHGIVSFKIRGYASSDIMILLDEHTIAVRGGDHCVSPEFADQDYVRISMQGYTTHEDIDECIDTIKQYV